ncbi:MAG: hypothetical protein SPI30_01355 [Prevotella sp.]|nr:hypothetical protein [Prevotella sp.]
MTAIDRNQSVNKLISKECGMGGLMTDLGKRAQLFGQTMPRKPNSAIRNRADFVRMSSRQAAGFVESVVRYAEEKPAEKMPTGRRKQSGSNTISEE